MTYKLEYAKFIFSLRVLEPQQLPAYKGSIIRGVMGRAFRQTCCASNNDDCRTCILASGCAYAYVFETLRVAVGGGPDYSFIPHPFILEPPLDKRTDYSPGETLEICLVLVGRGISYLPYFIFAFDRLGQYGLGPDRAKLRLEEVAVVEEEIPRPIFRQQPSPCIGEYNNSVIQIENPEEFDSLSGHEESQETLIIDLITPFRFRDKGRIASSLSFPLLMRNIFRRLDLLGKAHGSGGMKMQFDYWLKAAEGVRLQSMQVSWFDWDRYSSRQRTRVSLGGLIGKIEINGPWKPFLPFLEAVRVVHIGKGTSFGLGKIELLKLRKEG